MQRLYRINRISSHDEYPVEFKRESHTITEKNVPNDRYRHVYELSYAVHNLIAAHFVNEIPVYFLDGRHQQQRRALDLAVTVRIKCNCVS